MAIVPLARHRPARRRGRSCRPAARRSPRRPRRSRPARAPPPTPPRRRVSTARSRRRRRPRRRSRWPNFARSDPAASGRRRSRTSRRPPTASSAWGSRLSRGLRWCCPGRPMAHSKPVRTDAARRGRPGRAGARGGIGGPASALRHRRRHRLQSALRHGQRLATVLMIDRRTSRATRATPARWRERRFMSKAGFHSTSPPLIT
jgi:hypothetical protein